VSWVFFGWCLVRIFLVFGCCCFLGVFWLGFFFFFPNRLWVKTPRTLLWILSLTNTVIAITLNVFGLLTG